MSKEAREALAEVISAINIDLKCFSEKTYASVMGGKLSVVLDNIRFFY